MLEKILKGIIRNLTPWMEQDKKIYKLYKKSNKWIKRGSTYLAYYYSYKIYKKYGCIISPKAQIGQSLKLPHPIGIVIGEGVKIGDNVVIYQNVTIGRKNMDVAEYPIIGNNVIIYCNSVIIGNIIVGDNSTIGCNTVVLKSVDKNSTCTGVVK